MLKRSILGKLFAVCMLSSFLLVNAKDFKTEYDAEKIADIFYELNGDKKEPHKKINHTKGFCAIGEFIPTKNNASKFDIPLFANGNIQTQVRYSLGGGSPKASDKSKPRGMALKIEGNNDSWEIVVLNMEINFAKTIDEFAEFFTMRIPKNGKVDSEYIKKRTNEVASYKNFEKYLNSIGITGSVANTAYYSIHTFYFKDAKSKKFLPARFKFVPTNGISYLSKEELANRSDDFLESDFKNHVAKKPIEYKMILVYANPKDITNDTTALWNGKHKELEIGTLKVSKYDGVGCNGDVFMPNVLPSGVGEPKDPLFNLRNDTYSITFGRRQ